MRLQLVCGVLFLSSCAGQIDDPGGPGPGDIDDPGDGLVCDAPRSGPSPLRRLTRLEYNNAVRDLLGDSSRPADAFQGDETVAGFAANSQSSISEVEFRDYVRAAEVVATGVLARRGQVIGCEIAAADCAEPWLTRTLRLAYRRPPTADESADVIGAYRDGKARWDAEVGLSLAVQIMLLSPNFLYHVELDGQPVAGSDVSPVGDYEMASRLSFLVWRSIPDDPLLDAAEAGQLRERDDIEAAARRMLDDPRAADSVAAFFSEWMQLSELADAQKDPELFPRWTESLAAAMAEESRRFTTDLVLGGGGTLIELLTATYSFVDAELARHYGVPAPATPFGRVELDPSQRSGILTQASLLASHAHGNENSWVLRGKFVREQLLCGTMQPPPPGVDQSNVNDPNRLQNDACKGCHRLMDPIGLGFEQFDPTGAFIGGSAPGEILQPEEESAQVDVAGPFDGAVELGAQLAGSQSVADCLATQWFRYALNRVEQQDDACSVRALQNRFDQADLNLRELMVAVTAADAFRHRRAPE